MIHPSVMEKVAHILKEQFVYPEDILEEIRKDEGAWTHFQRFSESYKRIRIAYIDSAREGPEEFAKRLNNFIENTKKGKMIAGYGGIDKYY